ncbi:MAM and LDL-receptor class A domain-containing protein 2-like [Aplysia californica]|uniref:MAM and LDL-receptor class A domain-containing protein 2-like n=1 Tax=Aplysia californica TaxID=6500 RepID=A0ABM1VYX7_APLCA|nr:MAM and LDL-receptor class A domain-containing protein 2-like [Aplysia californica]
MWIKTGSQGPLWRNAQIDYSATKYYELAFVADRNVTSTSYGQSYVAIDDVVFTDAACSTPMSTTPSDHTRTTPRTFGPTSYDCDFEQNTTCQWTQDTTDDFNWDIQKGRTNSYNTGPLADHTSGTGTYIYTESSGKSKNDTARLISRDISVPADGICLVFWYNMHGGDIGTLNVYASQGGSRGNPLWSRVGDQGQRWMLSTIHITTAILQHPASPSIKMVFEGVMESGYQGDIGLDDIEQHTGSCLEHGGLCDFEDSKICGFTNDATADFSWTRASGSTDSYGTGPKSDHTYDSAAGSYIYTEASSPRVAGDVARVIGPVHSPTTAKCAKFFYHMYGTSMGTLKVYLKSQNRLNPPVLTLSGNHKDSWLPAEFNISSSVSYQIVFEGTVNGIASDMAIDDLSISDGPCPAPGSCDFENGFCLYSNREGTDDFDWDINQDPADNFYSSRGPYADHTLGVQGHFMIAYSDKSNKGDTAQLISEALPSTNGSCLTFFVYFDTGFITSISQGSLTVLLDDDILGDSHLIHKMTVSKYSGAFVWDQKQLNITSSKPYQILFEAKTGDPLYGDIALDDITVSPGLCSGPPPRFQCSDGSGKSLPADQVCDFKADCNSGSDEAHCGSCTFEQDTCGLASVSDGSYRWKQAKDSTAPDVMERFGADHTFGNTSGHFMYVSGSSGRYDNWATLATPTLPPTYEKCQLEFYYQRTGGNLRVSVQVGSHVVELWTASIPYVTKGWTKADILIGHHHANIVVFIEGTKDFASKGSVAIDDITFVNCASPAASSSPCGANQVKCQNGVCIDEIYMCDLSDDCGDGTDESPANCSSSTQCTFESGFCGWMQDTKDQLDWTRNKGKTPSFATGPSIDHTTGLDTGYYIYVETSSPAITGQKARLLSPVIDAAQTSDGCHLTFYYHMLGATIKPLNIYTATEDGGYPNLIFTRQSSSQDFWDREILSLSSSKPFRVILEGVAGSFEGDMAIDDVSLSSGCKMLSSGSTLPTPGYAVSTISTLAPCASGSFRCNSGECISPAFVCDSKKNCADNSDELICGNCTFEAGLCGWKYASSGPYRWSMSYLQMMGVAGPRTDVNVQTSKGHYIYVRPDYGLLSSPAVIRSPPLGPIGSTCTLKFKYHIGQRAGRLNVSVGIGGNMVLVWTRPSSAISWSSVSAYIGRFAGPMPEGAQVEISFEADQTRTASNQDYAAIDDIVFEYCRAAERPPSLACSFDSNTCNWKQKNGDVFDWTRQTGSSFIFGTGPKSGHGGRGYYMYVVDDMSRKANDTADLVSLQAPATDPSGFCFSFWAYMHGYDIGTLQLKATYDYGTDDVLWSHTGTVGDRWFQQNVFVNMTKGYKLLFRATVAGSFGGGGIAIDDIATTRGKCPSLRECTFDFGFCDLVQETNDDFDWSLGSRLTASSGTGPSTDHTFGSSSGQYAYIDVSGKTQNQTAVLKTKTYHLYSACLTFWYHMYGSDIGALRVYKKLGNYSRSQIWHLEGDQGNTWNRATVKVYGRSSPLEFQFEGVVGKSYKGNIGIDDISVEYGSCPSPANCNFDNGFCGFVNVQGSDKFDWELNRGPTGSLQTGPQVDHTRGTSLGTYTFIETSRSLRLGDNAILKSDPVQFSGSTSCLEFWYNMYGAGIGNLTVYTRSSSSNVTNKKWDLGGDQGNSWKIARVALTESSPFEIMFEATYGGNYTGDIAIDDVRTFGYRCPTVYTPRPTTPQSTLASYPPTSLNCDFEEGFCLWKQSKTDDIDWYTRSGQFTQLSGPPSDHTHEDASGHYIYVRGTGQGTNIAMLESPTVAISSGGICFKFWYFMYGTTVDGLSIYAKSSYGIRELLWTRFGTRGPEWKFAQVHVQDMNGDTHVVIQGSGGSSFTSIIAVDDVSMNQGDCPHQPGCDFEDGLCNFHQLAGDDFDWTLKTSRTLSVNTGPQTDHSFLTREGHYIYTEASSRTPGQSAKIETPLLDPTTASCLVFWYSMNGAGMGTLNLLQYEDGTLEQSAQEIWSQSGPQGTRWHQATVTVSDSLHFRIIFEGIMGSNYTGDIALDDIILMPGMCPGLGTCDFEGELCTWTNSEDDDDLDWIRRRSFSTYMTYGPNLDHTQNTIYGGSMVMSRISNFAQGSTARLTSPTLSAHTDYCLNFWFYTSGQGQGSLNVTVVPMSQLAANSTLLSIPDTSTRMWKVQRVTLKALDEEFTVVLLGIIGNSRSRFIALDDISIQNGTCESLPMPAQTKNAFHCSKDNKYLTLSQVCDFVYDCSDGEEEKDCGYDCSFDSSECKWKNARFRYSQKWEIISGLNSSRGPDFDHTLGSANGNYLSSSSSGSSFQEISYNSPLLRRSAPTCELVFYLYAESTNPGHFRVKRKEGVQTVTLWTTEASLGNSWLQQVIPLGSSSATFSVIFSESTNYGYNSFSVDDIKFRNCGYPQPGDSCKGLNTFKCKNGACINPSLKCNFINDCGDGSDENSTTCASFHRCNFEVDFCNWTQEAYADNLDWSRKSQDTSKYHVFSTFQDHTISEPSGHYLSLQDSQQFAGDKAWLLSPILDQTSPGCYMIVHIHMSDEDVGNFNIYTRTAVGGFLSKVFSVPSPPGNFWKSYRIPLSSTTLFQVVLEAVLGYSSTGIYGATDAIGLDDIIFSSGCKLSMTQQLPTLIIPSSTAATIPNPCGDDRQWQCADKSKCIRLSQKCDFSYDCQDHSDEQNCGACDFETSQCGWRDMSSGEYIFSRVNSSSTDVMIKPSHDHTVGQGGTGWFLLVRDTGLGYASYSILESPIYGATEAGCEIQFYYMMEYTAGRLRVYLYPKDTNDYRSVQGAILLSSPYAFSTWNKRTIGIGSRAPGFKIIFRYEYKSAPTSYSLAIDDISFSKSCFKTQSTGSCGSGQFECSGSSECKPSGVKCDLAKDCANGFDEQKCNSYTLCDFERGTCGFVISRTLQLNWGLIKGQYQTGAVGHLARDHTYGNQTGGFMYINTRFDSGVNDTARLKSRIFFPHPNGKCEMRFFYYAQSNVTTRLNVYTETQEGGALSLKWSLPAQTGDEWKKAVVTLDDSSLFRVVIDGTPGSVSSNIGLDDFSFTPECLPATRVYSLPDARPRVSSTGSCTHASGPGFLCDGKCMPLKAMCDFHQDCTDGTDEKDCPSSCDFESGMCGWRTQATRSSYSWVRTPGNTFNYNDHKPGTANGHILYPKANTSLYSAYTALESPIFSTQNRLCSFSFWYRAERRPSMFSVGLRQRGFDTFLWPLTLDSRVSGLTNWTKASVKIPSCAADSQIIFNLKSYRHTGVPDIFLDDFAFEHCERPAIRQCKVGEFTCTDGSCIPEDQKCDLSRDCCDGSDEADGVCYPFSYSTFENGLGDWKTKISTGVEWSIRQPLISSISYSYPSSSRATHDHTTMSQFGHYLSSGSIYSSYLYNSTSSISRSMPAIDQVCEVRFWYLTAGMDSGKLSIYTETSSGLKKYRKIINAEVTGQWKKEKFSYTLNDVHQLVFESVNGKGASSSMNVDDIIFSPFCNLPASPPPTGSPTTAKPQITSPKPACPGGNFRCVTSGTCINQKNVCNFHKDCSDGSDEAVCHDLKVCSFDSNLCSWMEMQVDNLDWQQGQPSSIPESKGPRRDSAGTSGGYVYLNDKNNGNTAGQVASLTSGQFKLAAAECVLSFRYFMSGSGAGRLNLNINSAGLTTTLWTQTKSAGQWTHVNVGIGRRTSPFTLSFNRAQSSSFSGQMALDSLEFKGCGLPQSSGACSNDKFKCTSSGACVSKMLTCNLQDDCGDKSDETDASLHCDKYTSLTFETSMGGLQQVTSEQLDWQRWDSSQPLIPGLSGIDHSTSLSSGHYLFVKGQPNTGTGDSAWLVTDVFGATTPAKCEVSFFALIPSSKQSIKVGLRTHSNGGPDLHLHLTTSVAGTYWQLMMTSVISNSPFQLIFQGTPGDPDGALAIDDVVFGPGCILEKSLPLPSWPVTKAACVTGQFACTTDNKCISFSKKCDAVADCSDSADEKGCNCTNYCSNGGQCLQDSNQIRKCRCVGGFGGPRCKVPAKSSTPTPRPVTPTPAPRTNAPSSTPAPGPKFSSENPPPVSSTPTPVSRRSGQALTGGGNDDWKPAVGVVVPLVLVVIVCVSVYVYLRKTNKVPAVNWTSISARLPGSSFRRLGRRNDQSEEGGLNNPIYDYGSGGGYAMQDIEPPSLEEQKESYNAGTGVQLSNASMSLENPMYQEQGNSDA